MADIHLPDTAGHAGGPGSPGFEGPDTIVLIHGFWVTPRSWEGWVERYEGLGYRVVTPTYPGYEVEVEALNADPTPIANATTVAIVDHLVEVVGALAAPPILMGHSAGGAFTQLLLDRGLGAVGVAINSAPTQGVKKLPFSQVRSVWPALRSPANRHKAIGLTYEQWRYSFTNTFPEDQARATYTRYHIPASGGILWDTALANVKPGRGDTWVDYGNAARPPLLFVSGGADHIMPPSVQRSNAALYRTPSCTHRVEYDGRSHLMPAQDGWEEVADYALEWATGHAIAAAAGADVSESVPSRVGQDART